MNDFGPFIVPVVAMLIPIVAIIAGAYSQTHNRRLRAEQRMALIVRGVPLADIESFMKTAVPEDARERGLHDPMRSLSTARRTALVLISVGLGFIVFLLILGTVFLHHVDGTAGWVILAGAATGLIPLAIGLGFLFDYNLQKRELSRFGLEVGADK